MKIQENKGAVQPLAAPCEGESKATSVHTPQTIQPGETVQPAPAAGAQPTTERERAFRALMEGEYKDLFTAYFQETFNRRFKEHKQIKAELERARALREAAAQYFQAQDDEALFAALRVGKNQERVPQKGAEGGLDTPVESKAETPPLPRVRRPAENALGVAFDRMPGAGKMTREERAELAKRAARGEHVTL